MKYDLKVTDEIAKDIFNIARFDVDWAGGHSAFDAMREHLKGSCMNSAIDACVKSPSSRPEYDQGYVRGLYEVYQFLERARKTGEVNSRGR